MRKLVFVNKNKNFRLLFTMIWYVMCKVIDPFFDKLLLSIFMPNFIICQVKMSNYKTENDSLPHVLEVEEML